MEAALSGVASWEIRCLFVRQGLLLFLPSGHKALEHCSNLFSAAGRAALIRLCSTEDWMLNCDQQQMIVPDDLVQVRTESRPPQLLRLLFVIFVTGFSKPFIFDGRGFVHPATLLHPSVMDLNHVGVGEHCADGCFRVAEKV